MTAGSAPPRALSRRERAGLVALLVVVVAFGAVTLMRSAFLEHRHTDADVYFRAAWALHAGENLYKVTDTNGWHYHYPPLLAILLVPFADPPEGVPPGAGASLSYPVSVALWYIVSVIILWLALHLLASAIEAGSANPALREPARFERRWWLLRVLPVLICMPTIGYTLGRGQVNFLLLLSLCGMSASMLRGRNFRAGAWLALGACIKPYLAALLVYPFLLRNRRCLAGFAAGMFIGLALIPSLALGPAATAQAYRNLYELRLKGMITGELHPDIAGELDVLTGQFPTYGATIFKALHPNPDTWPDNLPSLYSAIQLAAGGALLAFTLLIIGRSGVYPHPGDPCGAGFPACRPSDSPDTRSSDACLLHVIAPGAILLVLIPAIATCKPHYYSLAALPVMGLIASEWEHRGEPVIGPWWRLLFIVFFVANFLSEITGVAFLQAGGVAPFASILLWLACLTQIPRLRRALDRTGGT